MDEVNAAYGKTVGIALQIVRQLHWDTMKLLTDFEGRMAGWASVFGNVVTSDISTVISSGRWMYEGVYRYYSSPKEPGIADGVTVAFDDYQKRSNAPLLLAARMAYLVAPGQEVMPNTVCGSWDIWELFFDKSEKRELNRVMTFSEPWPGRLKQASLIAVPLYSIENVGAVYQLLQRVRDQFRSEEQPRVQ
jgi:hypothetical protein